MRQHGRKSIDQVTLADVSASEERLSPPDHLKSSEKKLWQKIVESRSPDWFRAEHADALERYVTLKTEADQTQKKIRTRFKGEIPTDREESLVYRRLWAHYNKISKERSALERGMRLTQRSQSSKDKGTSSSGVSSRAKTTGAPKKVEWKERNGETRGERNIRWIEENCYVPEGKHVGEKVTLTKKQKSWVRSIYDSPTRTFILSMGRKNAKTAFAAFLMLLHLCGPEARPNSQLYSTGLSRDQAGIIFGYAAKCVRMSPPLRETVGIRDTSKQLYCPTFGTLYRALSADASTSYGLSPIFTVHDELGQVRGPRSELYEALETASAAQEAPLTVIISTQAPGADDLLSILIDDALTGADPKVKVEVYTASPDVDPYTDKAIRAANPHFDEFMNQDEVRRMAADAKRLPSRDAAYRNLILNQRVEARSLPLVSREIWKENGRDPQDITGKPVYGGLDLSSVSDLTSLVLISTTYDVIPTFWLPSEGLEEKSRIDRVPYDKWSQAGYLMTTPGRSVEYEFVAEYLREVFDNFEIRALAFDRYNMRFLRPWLVKKGFSEQELTRFVEFGQGFLSMSPAIREVESLLLSKKLRHGNHPVLSMCAANATMVSDPAGNRKFTKAKTTGRIDGMVALTMAVGAMPLQGVQTPAKKSYQMFFV